MVLEIIDLAFRPLRLVARLTERELPSPLEKTERDVLSAVNAIHRASVSIEHHVEVIEGLATSVGPLTDSVNQLTGTMGDLVALMGPMAAAERGARRAEREVERVERFFRFHRNKNAAGATGGNSGG